MVLLTIKVQKEGWLAIWQGSQDAGDHTLVAGTRVMEGGGGGGGGGIPATGVSNGMAGGADLILQGNRSLR